MYRPSRTRRIIKWISLIGLAVAVGFCAMGNRRRVQFGLAGAYAQVYGGNFMLGQYSGKYKSLVPNGLLIGDAYPSPKWMPSFSSYPDDWSLTIPMFQVVLVAVLTTVVLFYRDRRRILPGHCPRCGYDLTGNTSGKCSECGEKIDAGQRAATSTVRPEES